MSIGIDVPYFGFILGSENNARVHDLLLHALTWPKLQHGSLNTDAPVPKTRRITKVEILDKEVLMLTVLTQAHCNRLNCSERTVLPLNPANFNAHLAHAAAMCPAIDSTFVVDVFNWRCTVLPIRFGNPLPHYAMPGQSASTPRNDWQHAPSGPPFNYETPAMVPIEFIPQTSRN